MGDHRIRGPIGARRIIGAMVIVVGSAMLLARDEAPPMEAELKPEAGPSPAPMVVGDAAVAPRGFIMFCLTYPVECKRTGERSVVVDLTHDRLRELEDVQWLANHSIRPHDDPQHIWAYPADGAGDCNTYVLEKREMLLDRKWPRSSLLMAAAWTERHEGHLVLVIRTTSGDLVLDNRQSRVVDWKSLPYQWIARQSDQDPAIWVGIEAHPLIVSDLDSSASVIAPRRDTSPSLSPADTAPIRATFVSRARRRERHVSEITRLAIAREEQRIGALDLDR